MKKPTRKPAVRQEMRRQWFQRYEEDGESALHIAQTDGYDVRTVRKQIELERQEREGKEAKTLVLRDALEKHYADLCAFAKKLESQLGSERNMLATLRQDRMWSALREHQRRSVLWKKFERWEQLRDDIARLDRELEKLLGGHIELQLKSVALSANPGFDERLFSALIPHIKEAARGQRDLQSFDLEKIPESANPDIAELVRGVLKIATTWKPYNDLGRVSSELRRVHRILSDELAIIILRRVVPGRCRYCPV